MVAQDWRRRCSGSRLAIAIGTVLALFAWPASFHAAAPHRAPRLAQPAGDAGALRSPPVLRNISRAPRTVEVVLTASVVRLELAPGKVTEAYAYNGSVPGPTLDVHEGDRVIIHFRNELPEPTTIHWHGLHIPASMDGSPLRPVAVGARYDYVFTMMAGTAGTYWYHPHPDLRSGFQIAKGLFGAIIVRARDDPLRGIPERLLILSDNRFLPDGSVEFAAPQSAAAMTDEVNGREGGVLFVNGQVAPALSIRSGELQRWRVINVAAARIFRLALAGHTLLHVGSDGGLFDRPIEVRTIDLANSERVELLVRGTGKPGDRVA
ncbi:MAG: multicopper oxidase family protein, partial [Gemmatimonadetes bacterium]|nr:multicopper oxidase family protein [Gemmatimonadota bacterium]